MILDFIVRKQRAAVRTGAPLLNGFNTGMWYSAHGRYLVRILVSLRSCGGVSLVGRRASGHWWWYL